MSPLYAAPCATGCGEMVPTSTPKPGWYLCPGCARAARGTPAAARRPRHAVDQPVDAPDATPQHGRAGDDEEATT